jgi:hypothetical protein
MRIMKNFSFRKQAKERVDNTLKKPEKILTPKPYLCQLLKIKI